jgi:hypothetical protein
VGLVVVCAPSRAPTPSAVSNLAVPHRGLLQRRVGSSVRVRHLLLRAGGTVAVQCQRLGEAALLLAGTACAEGLSSRRWTPFGCEQHFLVRDMELIPIRSLLEVFRRALLRELSCVVLYIKRIYIGELIVLSNNNTIADCHGI